jgi:multiple sugar transport system permease protein
MAQITEVRRTAATKTLYARPSTLHRGFIAVVRHVILIGVTIAFMLPFYWMAISAFKPNEMVFSQPVQWWPNPVRWQNFWEAAAYPGFPFLRFLWNSTFYASGVTLGTVISCAAVGYGFARLRFPGRDLLFTVTVSTLMIPAIVTFIPIFLLFKALGVLGSYTPLILPSFFGYSFFGSAFFIFMMRQFFLGVPTDLADAARVDGAGEFRIFWQIMLPLVRPALIVMAVFTFLWTWHEFFAPLVYLSNQNLYPLSLGLFAFRAQRTTEWGLMMAGATMTTLPLVILFFFAQRYFLEGIRFTGLKG